MIHKNLILKSFSLFMHVHATMDTIITDTADGCIPLIAKWYSFRENEIVKVLENYVREILRPLKIRY